MGVMDKLKKGAEKISKFMDGVDRAKAEREEKEIDKLNREAKLLEAKAKVAKQKKKLNQYKESEPDPLKELNKMFE